MSDRAGIVEWETFTLLADPGLETSVDFDLRLSGSGATEGRTAAPGWDPDRPWYIIGHYSASGTWVAFWDTGGGSANNVGGYWPPAASGQSIMLPGPRLRVTFDDSDLLFVNLARRRQRHGSGRC